jgi:hypothetical protein
MIVEPIRVADGTSRILANIGVYCLLMITSFGLR